jgi:hypothetical protein
MKTIAVLFTAGLLAGCAGNPVAQVQHASPPQNYRQLAADALPGALKKISLDGAEISDLDPTVPGAELADFAACVKTHSAGNTEYFTVFYTDGHFSDVRSAVIADHCEGRVYSVLPPKSPAPKTGRHS